MTSITRTPLSQARIAKSALAIVDEDGLDALTMRRLGERMGYEAMAMYKHFSDKESLLDAVVGTIYEQMTAPDPAAGWRDQLTHSALELRRSALAHPHLFVRLVTRPPAHPAVVRRVDSVLQAIGTLHDDGEFVANQFRLFLAFTSGALLNETAAITGPDPTTGPDAGEANDELLTQCPALALFGPALATCDEEATYKWGITTVLDAMESAAHAISNG